MKKIATIILMSFSMAMAQDNDGCTANHCIYPFDSEGNMLNISCCSDVPKIALPGTNCTVDKQKGVTTIDCKDSCITTMFSNGKEARLECIVDPEAIVIGDLYHLKVILPDGNVGRMTWEKKP